MEVVLEGIFTLSSQLEVVHDCQSAMLLNADHALGTRSVRKLVARGAALAKVDVRGDACHT